MTFQPSDTREFAAKETQACINSRVSNGFFKHNPFILNRIDLISRFGKKAQIIFKC